MKSLLAIAAVVFATTFAAPALAQMGSAGGNYDDYTGGIRDPGIRDPRIGKSKQGNDPEGIAEDLRLSGQCDKAVPLFRRLAAQGQGFEISQFNLGMCLFDLAKANKDPAEAQALNKEGTDWVLRAANAGYGKAQAMAILVYLDGLGVAADPVEAGKWAYIFHDNGTRMVLGLPDLDPSLRGRLDSVLTGDKKREARARADSWTQTVAREDP